MKELQHNGYSERFLDLAEMSRGMYKPATVTGNRWADWKTEKGWEKIPERKQ